MAKVLLIEDDRETAEEVVADLRGRGHEVQWADTGPTGLDLARDRSWDILVTDRLLPGRDGLSVLQDLRSEGVRTPALVLSALSSVDERIRGLRAGGDDYLVKPFAFAELAARIEALLRRPAEPKETLLRVGSLELDLISSTAKRGGREIELLPREYRLLEYMMRRPGQTITRAMLFQDVWNYNFVPKSNLVDVHIGRLRHKLDGPGEPSLIQNVRGVGFVFSPDA
ncbi:MULTISPECIES: response regulator transcription factor [unclassified Xanthobacter]|uniref:response regulator transcription factor n=1 Tax=unclassified Xanthobacter TaxID=2623496 RepID=UPI001F46B840|nr:MULTISPECIES: response regulator transcription factor [unclassified Xanthobacter]